MAAFQGGLFVEGEIHAGPSIARLECDHGRLARVACARIEERPEIAAGGDRIAIRILRRHYVPGGCFGGQGRREGVDVNEIVSGWYPLNGVGAVRIGQRAHGGSC